jgi:hypothetical protein
MIDQEERFFRGNPKLKREGETTKYSPEQIAELKKCMNDPIYFASKYMKIVNVDKGLVPIPLYEHQKKLLRNFMEHRNNIVLASRQTGKCVSGGMKIKIRSKSSGEEMELPIEEFFNLAKSRGGSSACLIPSAAAKASPR